MRKFYLLGLVCFVITFISCHKDYSPEVSKPIPTNIKEFLENEGFSTYNVINVDSGYIVEGDIYLPNTYFDGAGVSATVTASSGKLISSTITGNSTNTTNQIIKSNKKIKIGTDYQYRTTSLVLTPIQDAPGTTRMIKIATGSNLPASYIVAVDSAIARYNKLNLALSFQRVSNEPDIEILSAPLPKSIVATSSFPSNGDPYQTIQLDVSAIGNSPNQGYLISLIAHEIGHAIGLRHTEYFNSSNNCPYSTTGDVDPTQIIQLPTTGNNTDPKSYLLACLDGANRPFTENDIKTLTYIYGHQSASGDGIFYRNPYTGDVYVIMEGRPRWINSLEALVALFGSYWNVDKYFISCPIGLPIGENLTSGSKLAKSSTTGVLYFIDNNGSSTIKRPIDAQLISTYQLQRSNITELSDSKLNSYQTSDPLSGQRNEGQLVRDSATGNIYVVINDSLRWIKDKSMINSTFTFTFNSTNIPTVISLTDLGSHISLGTKLIFNQWDGKYYILDVSNQNEDQTRNTIFLRLIPNSAIFYRYYFDYSMVQPMEASELAQYPIGEELL